MSSEVPSLTKLEKLLRDTEFENSRLLGQIDEEKQISVDLESQIFAQNAAVAKFEKSITKLQEETENLNDQCKINKEVSMSFRKSSCLVDSHIDQIQKTLEQIVLNNEKERESQNILLSNYSSKWLHYKEQWETQPLAIRMKEIKSTADLMEENYNETLEQIKDMKIRIDTEKMRKETEQEEQETLMNIIIDIANVKAKTNRIFTLLQEDRKNLTPLKSKDMELQHKQKEQQEIHNSLAEIQVSDGKNEQLDTTCLEQSTESAKKQMHQTQKEGVLQCRDSFKFSAQVNLPQARFNMPNKSCNQISITKKFMEITVPSVSTQFRPNKNTASKIQGENYLEHEQSSLQLPSIAAPSTISNIKECFDSIIPLHLPQISCNDGKWQNIKSAENLGFPTLPSFPSLHSLPPTSPNEEKGPRSSLKSDRSLMKAPSKGSPGARKSKTPFDRKSSSFNKTLTQGFSQPIQSNGSPEKSEFLPIQSDKIPKCNANSPIKAIESTEERCQRTNESEKQEESSFVVLTSSYDNADQNALYYSMQTGGSENTNITNAVTRAFNSPGVHLNIDQHTENIKNFTKSPGDGFFMESRPMFQQCSEEKEQQNANGNLQRSQSGGFFASSSFINPSSLFSFGPSSSLAQSVNENDFQINTDNGGWLPTRAASSFQQEEAPRAFSFLESPGTQNDTDISTGGFTFGFSSGVSDDRSTGFSLF